jgi:hypothetical protein
VCDALCFKVIEDDGFQELHRSVLDDQAAAVIALPLDGAPLGDPLPHIGAAQVDNLLPEALLLARGNRSFVMVTRVTNFR